MGGGNGGNGDGAGNKPVLLRFFTADKQTVFEVVARVELADDVFSRTLVMPSATIGCPSVPLFHFD